MKSGVDGKLKVRGVTISDPLELPFAQPVRILQWTGTRGEIHLKVVDADISAATVELAMARHVCGTQYLFVNAGSAP